MWWRVFLALLVKAVQSSPLEVRGALGKDWVARLDSLSPVRIVIEEKRGG